jgi:Concanavalin A-like lectin/glucanases superfamily
MNTFLPLFYMNSIFPTKYFYNQFPTISGPAYWILVILIALIILFLVINLLSGIIELGRSGSRNVNLFGNDRNTLSGATNDFITANSIIAKIAFLIVVLILFVLALRAGIAFFSWLFSPTPTPHLIDGMVDAKHAQTFGQDPRSTNYAPIVRSTNGLGFTWSVWIYINDYNYLNSQYKHVFSKGNTDLNPDGLVYPNNAPGVYLTPNDNNLLVIMNTFETINEESILIPDIPINKWIHIVVRCDGSIVDVHINGTFAQSIHLPAVAKQNYGDVSMSLNGGFSGHTSNLWYYNYPLGTAEIRALFKWGPNTNEASQANKKATESSFIDYLSLRWFFGGVGDQYYPNDSGNLYRP